MSPNVNIPPSTTPLSQNQLTKSKIISAKKSNKLTIKKSLEAQPESPQLSTQEEKVSQPTSKSGLFPPSPISTPEDIHSTNTQSSTRTNIMREGAAQRAKLRDDIKAIQAPQKKAQLESTQISIQEESVSEPTSTLEDDHSTNTQNVFREKACLLYTSPSPRD